MVRPTAGAAAGRRWHRCRRARRAKSQPARASRVPNTRSPPPWSFHSSPSSVASVSDGTSSRLSNRRTMASRASRMESGSASSSVHVELTAPLARTTSAMRCGTTSSGRKASSECSMTASSPSSGRCSAAELKARCESRRRWRTSSAPEPSPTAAVSVLPSAVQTACASSTPSAAESCDHLAAGDTAGRGPVESLVAHHRDDRVEHLRLPAEPGQLGGQFRDLGHNHLSLPAPSSHSGLDPRVGSRCSCKSGGASASSSSHGAMRTLRAAREADRNCAINPAASTPNATFHDPVASCRAPTAIGPKRQRCIRWTATCPRPDRSGPPSGCAAP